MEIIGEESIRGSSRDEKSEIKPLIQQISNSDPVQRKSKELTLSQFSYWKEHVTYSWLFTLQELQRSEYSGLGIGK